MCDCLLGEPRPHACLSCFLGKLQQSLARRGFAIAVLWTLQRAIGQGSFLLGCCIESLARKVFAMAVLRTLQRTLGHGSSLRAPPHTGHASHRRECGNPRLRSFRGRAMDFTPKARILHFLGYASMLGIGLLGTVCPHADFKLDAMFA